MNIGDFEDKDFDTLEELANKYGFAEIITQLSNVAHLRWVEALDAGRDASPLDRVYWNLDRSARQAAEEGF